MQKRKIVVSLVVAIVVSFVLFPNNGYAYSYWDNAYEGDKAASYAAKWATSYNTTKYYKASLDCTNFVSQCLETGGKTRSSSLPSYNSTNHWRPHSATWENANYFKKYWTKKVVSASKDITGLSKYAKKTFATKVYKRLYTGDIVQYGYGTDSMKHSQIVHDYGTYYDDYYNNSCLTLKMAQHTGGRKNIDIHEYIRNTDYTFIRYYSMHEIK